MHVLFICAIGTGHACTCVFMSVLWRRPFLPSAMPAVPTIGRADRLPDRPLNPPPGTLTASLWEADPEGPEAPPPAKPRAHVLGAHICTAAVKRLCSHEELAARSIYQLPPIRTLKNLLELPLLLCASNPHSECLTVTHTCTITLRSNRTIRCFVSSVIVVNKLLDDKDTH